MTQLRHKKCGGSFVLDVTGLVKLVTPSFSATLDGINIGVIELVGTSSSSPGYKLFCTKCGNSVELNSDESESQCSVCRRYKPTGEIEITKELSGVCKSCMDALRSEGTPSNSTIAEFKSFINIDKNTPHKNLLSILEKGKPTI